MNINEEWNTKLAMAKRGSFSVSMRYVLIVYSIFFATSCTTLGGEFDDFIETGELYKANHLFQSNRDEFLSNPSKYEKRLDALATAFDNSILVDKNSQRRKSLYKAAEKLDDENSWEIIEKDWRRYNNFLNNRRNLEIYSLRSTLFKNVNNDSKLMLTIADESQKRYHDRLRTWDLTKDENVYKKYGIGVSLDEAKSLFLEKLTQDMPVLASLPEPEIHKLRVKYKNIWPESIDSELGNKIVTAVLKNAAMLSGRVSVSEFHHSEKVAKILGVTVDIPKAKINYISDGRQLGGPLIQDENGTNFQFAYLSRSSAAASLASPLVLPVVYVLPQGVSIDETLLETKAVKSSFKTGIVEKANPEYVRIAESISRLKSELVEAERAVTAASHSKEDVMDAADPRLSDGLKALVGLVAITSATSSVKNEIRADSLRRKIRTAESQLSSTPRMISTPKMSTYQFQAVDVRAKRQERFTLAVYDMFTDSFDVYKIKIERDKKFTVPEGIYENDANQSKYDKLDDYLAALTDPLVINYREFLTLINPNSPGHMLGGVPRIELINLIRGNPIGEG